MAYSRRSPCCLGDPGLYNDHNRGCFPASGGRLRCLLDFGKRQRMRQTKAITRRVRPGRALRHACDHADPAGATIASGTVVSDERRSWPNRRRPQATQIRGVMIVPIGGAQAADSAQHRERVAPGPARPSAGKESVRLRGSCTARRTRPRGRRCQSLRMSRAGWRSWSAARPIANLRGRGCWPGAISQRRAPVRTWIPAGRAMGSPIRPLLTGGGWTPI